MSFLSMIQQAAGGCSGGKIPLAWFTQRAVSVISCDIAAWEPQRNMFAVFS